VLAAAARSQAARERSLRVVLRVMHMRPLTRRSLLSGAAGAGAAALMRRPVALAALGAPEARVAERPLGALAAGVTRIELARNADLVGVQWRASPRGGGPRSRVELSFRDAAGGWSAWVPAGAAAHGPDRVLGASANGAAIVGEPVWAGGTREIALRSDRPLASASLHLVDVSDGVGASRLARAGLGPIAGAASLPLAEPTLAAGAGQPPIIARRAWARGRSRPRVAPAYGAVRVGFVHHTENPNGYSPGEVPAMLRAIFAFHTYVNGWNDIGYNFAIDAFGRIFEARAGGIDEPVTGAQAGGYNYASTGVAVLGSFQSARISRAAHASLVRLLAWKLSLHGVPAHARATVKVNPGGAVWSKYPANAQVPLPTIAGHRDADSTDCPGDALYAELPGIRAAVARLAPLPTRATLALSLPAPAGQPATAPEAGTPGTPAASAPPSAPPPSAGAIALTGTLALSDGAPVAGVPVAIQVRRVSARGETVLEQTLASAQTDANGVFATTLPPQPAGARIALRALFLGGAGTGAHAGAAVSAPLAVTPAANPAPATPAPTAPAPAPAPGGAP
jgi:hypothetical protein